MQTVIRPGPGFFWSRRKSDLTSERSRSLHDTVFQALPRSVISLPALQFPVFVSAIVTVITISAIANFLRIEFWNKAFGSSIKQERFKATKLLAELILVNVCAQFVIILLVKRQGFAL